MEEIRQYLLRLIAAALICAAVQGFPQEAAAKAMTRLVCGVVMTLLVLSPLGELRLPTVFSGASGLSRQASEAALAGEQMSRFALGGIIKEEAQAYILDEAEAMGIQLEVDITVSRDELPIPESAVIRGSVPSHLQKALETLLHTKLGIPKENVTWIS